jgi:hypothetical protein
VAADDLPVRPTGGGRRLIEEFPVPGTDPSSEPAADVPAEATDDTPADAPGDTEAVPTNRAERRARKGGQLPTHAGPQSAGHTRRGKGPRSHTKRV